MSSINIQFDFIAENTFTLAAVYDGHGGTSVSLYLKENFLKKVVSHPKFSSEPAQSLVESNYNFNKGIQEVEKEVI